jgi:cardiolipin synthase A/B
VFDRLLSAGVEIYQFQEPVLHAESMAGDGELCLVGSLDVDRLERRNTMEFA